MPLDDGIREGVRAVEEDGIETIVGVETRDDAVRRLGHERHIGRRHADPGAVLKDALVSCSAAKGLMAVWVAPVQAKTTVDAPEPISNALWWSPISRAMNRSVSACAFQRTGDPFGA